MKFPKPVKKEKKPRRLKSKSSSERSKLIRLLDAEMSRIVRSKYECCVICGSTNQLGNGHVFTKGKGASILRWDLRNCFTQCWPCNYRHVRDTYPYFNWFINKFGKGAFDILYVEWKQPAKFTNVQLREKLEELKKL